MRAGALGVAACLGWLLLRSAVSPVAPSAAPTAHAALPVTVRYAPMAASPGAARVDCFQSTPQEACVMMALFQTWNSACECLIWELHRWEDGAALASVRAGESVDVPLNVSDDPPVTQMFVVAVARERNAMPSDAEHLLDCLMRAAPGPGSPNDMAAYSSAVSGCLPEGVTVVPTSFVVK